MRIFRFVLNLLILIDDKLLIEFVYKYNEYFDWLNYSLNCSVYDEFVAWESIVRNRKLSEGFIKRNTDRLDWDDVVKYSGVSDAFLLVHSEWFCN